MKRHFNLLITCKHNDPANIISTENGELVCKCGVIVDEKTCEVASSSSTYTPTLYHQVETGGDPRDMKVVNKNIHIGNSSSSEFSNICSKLDLKEFIRHRAWNIYHTLRSKTYFTRAKCAAFALYLACREGGQSVSESDIQDAVRATLCVKNVPRMLSLIYEMHDDAMKLGIDSNRGHSSSYYLNLAISSKQYLFRNTHDYDRFKVLVMNNFAHLNGNLQSRARRAAEMALSEMGMI